MHKYAIGIMGASGYSGIELCRILVAHPGVEVRFVASDRWEGVTVRAKTGIGGAVGALTYVPNAQALKASEGCTAVLLATPAEASLELVPGLLERGVKVVDLSGAFRLSDPAAYPRHYGFEHRAVPLLERAVYGLPELVDRKAIASARLVANPGCYPTAAVLALAPLAQRGLISSAVIDAKSGVSGAGRDGGERLAHVNVTENITAYAADGHRHLPEIEQEMRKLGADVPITFVPHLLPLDQGLLASCYVDLAEDVDGDPLTSLYAERYAGDPFVEVVETQPGVRDVRDTNLCRIHPVALGRGRAAIFAAIDNLWKGAAGQAVQNLNLMLGLDEAEGLD